MKYVFLSSTCSKKKYAEILNKRTIKSLDTNQKFFLSIIDGFKKNEINDITCISVLPISYKSYPDRLIRRSEEIIDGVQYIYPTAYNVPYIRTLLSIYTVKHEVKKILKKYKNDVVFIVDSLLMEFFSACKILKKRNIKTIAVVTDVPSVMHINNPKKTIKEKIQFLYDQVGDKNIKENFSGYVFLTEQMNRICNPSNRPYIVIEGIAADLKFPEKIQVLGRKPIVLYAGKYNKEFGTLNLANSAEQLKDICDIVMYGGHGDCIETLLEISKKNDNLTINGIIPLEELLLKETQCDLLINPRNNNNEFTKYSFPSKTIEYMQSGTPVLMYKLDGIPQEYDEYLTYIKEDSSNGIAKAIKDFLSISNEERWVIGSRAKEFVANKDAVKQTNRILRFINELFIVNER